jgi:hypothetical protein
MKKSMYKIAIAALSVFVLSACQSEDDHGHSHDVQSLVKSAIPVANTAAVSATEPKQGVRQDEMKVTLTPNQSTEVKLIMVKGARVEYTWATDGGLVNHDTHGETAVGGAKGAHRYSKAVQVNSDKGEIVAAFDGEHGWFWRNRSGKDVTITLKVSGQYKEIKQKI